MNTKMVIAATCAAGWLLGCGSGDADGPDTRQMMSASPQASLDAEDTVGRPPTIERLEVHPPRATPGTILRAKAIARTAAGKRAELIYRWQTARGRKLGDTELLDTRGLQGNTRIELEVTAVDGDLVSEVTRLEVRLGSAEAQIGVVEIDDSDGRKPGSILRSVVETAGDAGGRYDVDVEWIVNGKRFGTDDDLDTAALQPGDVIELRARIETERGMTDAVESAPVQLTRGEAPRIVSEPRGGIEGGLFRYQILAKSSESGARLSYGLVEGPDGMAVDSASGVVTWRPTSDQRGRFEVEVSATDQWGTGTGQSFVIGADSAAAPAAPAR